MHNEVEMPPQKKQKRGSATNLTDKQLLCTVALGNLTAGNVSAALKQAKSAGEVSTPVAGIPASVDTTCTISPSLLGSLWIIANQ